MNYILPILGLFLAFGFSACNETKDTVQTSIPTPTSTPENIVSTKEIAVIKTSAGEMTIELFPDVAPKTVENFKKLSQDGFYNGTAFHRVIKGFMVQGGCPNTKAGASGTPGTGGPGYTIKAEFNNTSHRRGVISMARASHPDSAGCQFFICDGDASFLDQKYTAFGKLIEGDDVLEKIANTPVENGAGGEKSKPMQRIEIEKITIVTK